eukprot:TRINITY_DN1951_c0_g1_i2.p1 TRINITY_DN1951_c0_g1~~TRINITY_DN1951_c0_g1_i2.p1  ORF type:complete len:675 (+),score=188.93 TRINITY_DN1951_c0_g1_i2:90-2027(+)
MAPAMLLAALGRAAAAAPATLFHCRGDAEELDFDKDCDLEGYIKGPLLPAVVFVGVSVAVGLLTLCWFLLRCCCNLCGGSRANPDSCCRGHPRPRKLRIKKHAHPTLESACGITLEGAKVSSVLKRGVADRGGVKEGWLVTKLGKQKLHSLVHASPLEAAFEDAPEEFVVVFKPEEIPDDYLSLKYNNSFFFRPGCVRHLTAVCVALAVACLAVALVGLPKFKRGHRELWESLHSAAKWVEDTGESVRQRLSDVDGKDLSSWVGADDLNNITKQARDARQQIEDIDADSVDNWAFVIAMFCGALPLALVLCVAPCALCDWRKPLGFVAGCGLWFASVQFLGCALLFATHAMLSDACVEMEQLGAGNTNNFLGGVVLTPRCPQDGLTEVDRHIRTACRDNVESACATLQRICSSAPSYDDASSEQVYVCNDVALFGAVDSDADAPAEEEAPGAAPCASDALALPGVLALTLPKRNAADWGCSGDPRCSLVECAEQCSSSNARSVTKLVVSQAQAAEATQRAFTELAPLLNCTRLWSVLLGTDPQVKLARLQPHCEELRDAASVWRIALALGGVTLLLIGVAAVLGNKRFRPRREKYQQTMAHSPGGGGGGGGALRGESSQQLGSPSQSPPGGELVETDAIVLGTSP